KPMCRSCLSSHANVSVTMAPGETLPRSVTLASCRPAPATAFHWETDVSLLPLKRTMRAWGLETGDWGLVTGGEEAASISVTVANCAGSILLSQSAGKAAP